MLSEVVMREQQTKVDAVRFGRWKNGQYTNGIEPFWVKMRIALSDRRSRRALH